MAEGHQALSYLRKTTAQLLETRERLEEIEHRSREPIAIVGMGCRLPGGVRCPEDLWELVSEGRDAIGEFPTDRGWDLEGLETGEFAPRGGFIDGIAEFDAPFFGVTEEEARLMDPQQRLLLEVSWEMFESAGIDPTSVKGSRTGVLIGVSAQHYAALVVESFENEAGNMLTGTSGSMVSGRLAHTLGVEGPAVSVDAACASSALALHFACQALRADDCSAAIAGGVNVVVTPMMHLQFARQRLFALAADGRCKSFADGADGAGVAEGVGLVLLERLSDAERNGHEVLALIRGSAINQDGASNGLTAPNGDSHRSVAIDALRSAGVPPAHVDAVEAHGMGTPIGDSIEAEALLAVYGGEREAGRALRLGSVKSNLGHMLAAGGVTGVIKMVMAMRHGVLPKTLHVDRPSRFVDWSSGAVSLLTDSLPWESDGRPRCAAIHSFGMSGTNAHLILEESNAPVATKDRVDPDPLSPLGVGAVVPWVISGHDQAGLERQVTRLREFAAGTSASAAEIGRSLAMRPVLKCRAVVVGDSSRELATALADACQKASFHEEDDRSGDDGARVAFVFSGGDLTIGGSASLDGECPLFAARLSRCEEAIAESLGHPPLEADGPRLGERGVTTPGVPFSQQVALAEVLTFCGVRPAKVLARHKDRAAASVIAGELTLEEAMATESIGNVAGASAQTRESSAARAPLHVVESDEDDADAALAEATASSHVSAVVELGSGEVTRRLLSDSSAGTSIRLAVAIGGRGRGQLRDLLTALGHLWVEGVPVAWEAVFADCGAARVRLPTYAFERRRYWVAEMPSWLGRLQEGLGHA